MRPKLIQVTPETPDPNGVALSQTPGGAGSLTLNGTLVSGGVATLTTPAHIGITSAGDDSGRTFTLTGTDRYGTTITEAVTGANAGEAVSTRNFKTITDVAVDAATAGAVEVGPSDSSESAWWPRNRYGDEVSMHVVLSSGANLTYTVEHTLSNIQSTGFQESDAGTYNDATLAAKTTTLHGNTSAIAAASRVSVTGYVAGSIDWHILEETTR